MSRLNQISFLISKDISFCNRMITHSDLPSARFSCDDFNKVAEYNNRNNGIIDDAFFSWALENNISLDAIKWFVCSFSGINDFELNCLIDSLFGRYSFYVDESGNGVKFRFKSAFGEVNTHWYNDFVLSGIVCVSSVNLNIKDLFSEFHLQKSTREVKLKNIARYNGESAYRLLEILESKRVTILLEYLLSLDDVYIHWATLNLWYYALADIVDSVSEIPFMNNEIKNTLYRFALLDKKTFFPLLAQYDYPNIKEGNIPEFCNAFIGWIDSLDSRNSEEEFYLDVLRQGLKSSKRLNNLLYLQGNTDRLLIESFVPMYASRLGAFPNSEFHFDRIGIVEENISEFANIYCSNKEPYYDFLDSANSLHIQLSDLIAGITCAFMAFINICNTDGILNQLHNLTPDQKQNLKLFCELRIKSANHNMFFDYMSNNFDQTQKIKLITDYLCR